MPRGQLENYKIGNRSYSITQLLNFGAVREVVSSRKTEGSKRELLRDLLCKNVIMTSMLTDQGAAGPSTYGAQRARQANLFAPTQVSKQRVSVVITTHFMRDLTIQTHPPPYGQKIWWSKEEWASSKQQGTSYLRTKERTKPSWSWNHVF